MNIVSMYSVYITSKYKNYSTVSWLELLLNISALSTYQRNKRVQEHVAVTDAELGYKHKPVHLAENKWLKVLFANLL
jgi:histone acetyltransferase (RNA polymerase elongator complex component)